MEIKFKEPAIKEVKSNSNVPSFLSYLMGCRDILKIMHWKTTSYAIHKALDKCQDGLLDITDSIAEKSSGYLGTHLSGFKDFSVSKYENTDPSVYIKEVKNYVQKERYTCFPKDYSPIQNELDNLTNLLDQTLYLLSLK